MATEFITKNNGNILVKFHASSKKSYSPFREDHFAGLLPSGFRCIVYVTKNGTIAQYKGNLHGPVNFSKYYHRPATPERVLALMKEVAGVE